MNGDGSFRPISNFFTEYKGRLVLGVFDWAKAYRQIPVAMNQWRFLMILGFDNYVYVDTRVQFGGVAGCGTFGEAAEEKEKQSFKNTEVLVGRLNHITFVFPQMRVYTSASYRMMKKSSKPTESHTKTCDPKCRLGRRRIWF